MKPLKRFPGILLITAVLTVTTALTLVGCDTLGGSDSDLLDATGTITGRVIDRVSSTPLEGVRVNIAGASRRGSSAFSRSATTDADGAFKIEDVPVNVADDGAARSSTYSLLLNLEDVDGPYRPQYAAEVEVNFSRGAGLSAEAAYNLVAGLTLPVSKLNASVSGQLTLNDTPLSNTELALHQHLPLRLDADGNVADTTDVKVASVTTDGDGHFSFDNVEEGVQAYIAGADGQPLTAPFSIPSSNGEEAISVNKGTIDASALVDDFVATLVSPERGMDISDARPTFTFAFSQPVAENGYTTPGPFGTGTLIDYIDLTAQGAKAQRQDGSLEVEVTFNEARDEMTIIPTDSLQDAHRYAIDMGAFANDQFVDRFGRQLDNRFDFGNAGPGASGDPIAFSIGLDTETPAAPDFALLADQQANLNYSIAAFTERFVINDVPANIKGFEVHASTKGAPFEHLGTVTPDDFETTELEVGFGNTYPFTDADNPGTYPFQGERGAYTPVRIKVRAVSKNLARSDFSDVVTLEDNVAPGVTGALAWSEEAEDDDGNTVTIAERIRVDFSEHLDADAAKTLEAYSIYDSNGDVVDGALDGATVELQDARQQVILVLDEDPNDPALEEGETYTIAVGDAVTDLAGNSTNVNDSTASFTF